MGGQRDRRSPSPSLAYLAVAAVVWVTYVGLVLLASQVLAFASPVAVAVVTLAAAAVLTPLRLRAQRIARRWLAGQ